MLKINRIIENFKGRLFKKLTEHLNFTHVSH